MGFTVILIWTATIAVFAAASVYGVLAPFERSRTGIGLMISLLSVGILVLLTLLGYYGFEIPVWLQNAGWILLIVAISWGITWNIIYKQFIEHSPDEIKTGPIEKTEHPKENRHGEK